MTAIQKYFFSFLQCFQHLLYFLQTKDENFNIVIFLWSGDSEIVIIANYQYKEPTNS